MYYDNIMQDSCKIHLKLRNNSGENEQEVYCHDSYNSSGHLEPIL